MCFFKRNRSCFTEGGSTCLHPVKRTRRLLIVCRQSCTGSGVLITRTDKGFFPSTEYHKWVQRTSVSFSFFNRHIRSNGDLHCAVQPLSGLSIYSLEADIARGTPPLRFSVVWHRNSVLIKNVPSGILQFKRTPEGTLARQFFILYVPVSRRSQRGKFVGTCRKLLR